MLGGDFNAANIDWDTGIVPASTDNRLMKEKLVTVLAEAGLTQMQRDPTRGQNLLDLFCCNKPSLVKSCISIPGISDHSIVLADCDLKTPITNKPQRRVYRWSKADWLKIKGLTTTFTESFLALVANSRSVNDNYVVFKKFMEGLLKTDIPSKLSGSRNKLPWINTELKRQIRKKGRQFSKAKKSGLKEDWDNYKAMEKDVKCNLNPLVPGLFSLKSAYRPEAYFGKLMYEGHLFLEMLLFCNPLTYNAVWYIKIKVNSHKISCYVHI